MTISRFFSRPPAPARRALWTAAAVAFAAAAPSAEAADENIYMGVGDAPSGAPQVVFVFSDGDASGFAPLDAFSIEIDQEGTCVADFDASPEIGAAYRGAPIYGPASGQRTLPAANPADPRLTLTSYFAREAVAKLLEERRLSGQEEAVPYFNCVGQAWAVVLSNTGEAPQQ